MSVNQADAAPAMATRQGKPQFKKIGLWLGLPVSGLFLYLVLRGVDLNLVGEELRSANYALIGLAVFIGIIGNLIRAARWGTLLGLAPLRGLPPLFSSMMIGYFANNVLPARLGELVRIWVLERKTGISKVKSAATIVVERLADVLLLLVLVGLTSLFVPLPALVKHGAQMAALVFGVIAVGLVLLALKGKHLITPIVQRIKGLSSGVGALFEKALTNFVEGLTIVNSPTKALLVLSLSLLIWGTEWIIVSLITRSMGLTLPWVAPLFVSVVLALSFVVPAAPGALGTYEFFVVMALSPFGVSDVRIVAFALVMHAFVLITTSAQGLICLWAESISFSELAKAGSE